MLFFFLRNNDDPYSGNSRHLRYGRSSNKHRRSIHKTFRQNMRRIQRQIHQPNQTQMHDRQATNQHTTDD